MNKEFFYKQIDALEKLHPDINEMALARHMNSVFVNLQADPFQLRERKNNKKILSVEVGYGHDVIRPSLYKYFRGLGYEVDFLLCGNKPEDRWNFFHRIKDYKARELIGNEAFIAAVLSLPVMEEYDYIFLNSNFVYNQNRFDSNLDYKKFMRALGLKDRCKHGFLTIPPHPAYYENTDTNLRHFTHLGTKHTPMLSVSYFGDVKITPKSDKNIFLVTGNINHDQKNHDMVFEAVRQLLDEGVTNFELWINGMLMNELVIPPALKEHIKYLGENKPETLFPILEQADFIIAGLDSTQQWQRNSYAQGTCSVGLMYSMGFGKVYILEDMFASAFGLNDQQAIIYSKGMLASAMKKAIALSTVDYASIQGQILQEAARREERSFKDIEQTLKELKRVYRKSVNSGFIWDLINKLNYLRLKICYFIFKNRREHYAEKLKKHTKIFL